MKKLKEAFIVICLEVSKEWTKKGLIIACLLLFAVNAFQAIDRYYIGQTIQEQERTIEAQSNTIDEYKELFQSAQDEAHELLKISEHIKARNPHVPLVVVDRWAKTIQEGAQFYNLNIAVTLSLFRLESATIHYSKEGFVIVSYAGAGGLGQIMPFWAEACPHATRPKDLDNANVNILCSAFILRQYLNENNNDIFLALTAYNAGPKGVRLMLRGVDITDGYAKNILAKI